ncbi:hypothetical protein ACEPAF_9519 [Sanghuangporus sanghuang]
MISSMSRIYFLFFSFVITLVSLVSALPVDRRDVWVPPITSPTEGTIWTIGNLVNVTWDTSTKPDQVTNPLGRVQLRKDGHTSSDVLAEGFNLTDGSVEITVPDVTPDFGYQVVLFGDSGNFSPEFEIVAA